MRWLTCKTSLSILYNPPQILPLFFSAPDSEFDSSEVNAISGHCLFTQSYVVF